MQGYFVIAENKNEPFDIKCELHPDYAKKDIPQKQEMLYIKIESTNNIIKSLYNTKDETKYKYFNKLLTLAQAGLVGETAQPELALKSLVKLKDEMVLVEGQRIKNDYMVRLGQNALIFCVIAFIAYIVFQSFSLTRPFAMYLLTFIGALIGTWISFGARKFSIRFEQLSLLEDDMMKPCIRLLYIGICAIVFVLFLNTQLINISIGGISTAIISENIEIQVSIGVLCGLVESKIGINVYKEAINILSDEEIPTTYDR